MEEVLRERGPLVRKGPRYRFAKLRSPEPEPDAAPEPPRPRPKSWAISNQG
jgi:hypothetical protein